MKITSNIYKWIYIAIATCISTIVLYKYAKALPELISTTNLMKEITMCSGQIIWQGIILLLFIKEKISLYLYHMITVSLIGSTFLIPLIIFYQFQEVGLVIRVSLFFMVVLWMIYEHKKRVKKLKLPAYLTLTWITYRVIWLPILLI